MKKVLAIAPYPYLPFFSGGQKFIAKFFEHLSREVDLTVISVAENDTDLARNYKIIPLLKRSFYRYLDLSLVKKITRMVRQEKYDAIIWEHPYYSWLAARIKKRTGIKTIIHTHNIEYQRFKSLGKWWWYILKNYERKCLQKADAVFFISPADKDFAITNWNLAKEKCFDVPFGIDVQAYPEDKAAAKELVCRKHNIDISEKILLFNGLLSYRPNLDAVKDIIAFTNVVLRGEDFKYKIIICGKGLPDEVTEFLKDFWGKNIIYAGFVDDIVPYFKAADIFLNPIKSGGGIKTKMVEAIAYGSTVIATETGASGILKEVCGEKLVILPDDDWQGFGKAAIVHSDQIVTTPPDFYQYYYWGFIIRNLVEKLSYYFSASPKNN
jgi:glycosyltransferase involved in cell wall biosynthesis